MVDSVETDPEYIALQIQTGFNQALAVDAQESAFSSPASSTSGGSVSGGSGGFGGGFNGGGEGQGGTGTCFTGYTLVLMADGAEKEIWKIECGDCVASFNEFGHLRPARVTGIQKHETREYLKVLFADGHKVCVTSEHRYWQGHWKFKAIGEFKPGDEVRSRRKHGWEAVEIISIETVKAKEPTLVYNIEVEIYHVYIASGDAVHNSKSNSDQLLQT